MVVAIEPAHGHHANHRIPGALDTPGRRDDTSVPSPGEHAGHSGMPPWEQLRPLLLEGRCGHSGERPGRRRAEKWFDVVLRLLKSSRPGRVGESFMPGIQTFPAFSAISTVCNPVIH